MAFPRLRQTVLDCTDPPVLAEFYRQLLGLRLRSGDGPDWQVLQDEDGTPRLAFQQVDELPEVTWPTGVHPQMLHLDLTVPSIEDLLDWHVRALELGARLLLDRIEDPVEPLRVYADPAGHPFCLFAAAAGEPHRRAAGVGAR